MDEIPEAMEAAVVLCEVVRPLPLKSKWRLVRHGVDFRVVRVGRSHFNTTCGH